MKAVTLIAVVGPVEPDLLTAFVVHYRLLGVTRFLLAYHLPTGTDPDRATALLTRHKTLLRAAPTVVSRGPRDNHTITALREALRREAGNGWHILADVEEFQAWPGGIWNNLAMADAACSTTVGGLCLDRVANAMPPVPWGTTWELDHAYPLGGFVAPWVLRTDPRRIVAARDGVVVSAGRNRAAGTIPVNWPPIAVHHFRWLSGAATVGPGSGIDLSDPRFDLRPVNLALPRVGWARSAELLLCDGRLLAAAPAEGRAVMSGT